MSAQATRDQLRTAFAELECVARCDGMGFERRERRDETEYARGTGLTERARDASAQGRIQA